MARKSAYELQREAADLRAEADRIEAEELKAERLAEAATIPTCPECGGRVFEVPAYTTADASISFEEATSSSDGEWDGDNVTEGEHTDDYCNATCSDCGADVRAMLEGHGWTFYDAPRPRGEHDDATCTRREPLDLIHAALDGRHWTADTLDSIAAILRAAGYVVRSPEEADSAV
jgi:hypothetical protein